MKRENLLSQLQDQARGRYLRGGATTPGPAAPTPGSEQIHPAPVRREARVSLKAASGALGISARALRYYDGEGLVLAERDGRNRRVYSAQACQELEVVARLRGAGVPVEEIRWVLEAARRSGASALRNTAIDCLTHRLSLLAGHRLRAEQALDWVRAATGSAEDEPAQGSANPVDRPSAPAGGA
jgi:DNA-binding transcriptional MerR regulator